MLKNRAGFSLAEVLIALTLTAVIGAAVTGVFISQSRFFDHQEKVGAARAVSRGALNIMMSEMRMIDQATGVVSASDKHLQLNVPYAFGMVCDADATSMSISLLPVDSLVFAEAAVTGGHTGVAIRDGSGTYTYVTSGPPTVVGTPSTCPSEGIGIVGATSGALSSSAGQEVDISSISLGTPPVPGTPVFLYQVITYEFKPSAIVPGSRIALWRKVNATNDDQELVAPFDANAQFRYYVNDAATASSVPGSLDTVTGVEIVLDAVSERPNSDGTYQTVPLTTSVFFKNR